MYQSNEVPTLTLQGFPNELTLNNHVLVRNAVSMFNQKDLHFYKFNETTTIWTKCGKSAPLHLFSTRSKSVFRLTIRDKGFQQLEGLSLNLNLFNSRLVQMGTLLLYEEMEEMQIWKGCTKPWQSPTKIKVVSTSR